MTQISRLRNAEIANGNLINADDIAVELNQLVSESNSQDTRLTGIESGNMSISGNKTLSGNSTFNGSATLSGATNITGAATLSGTVSLTGQTNLSRSSDPALPKNGDLWYNATGNTFKAGVQIANVTGATNASPIVITTDAVHGRSTGNTVFLASVGGNTAANGAFTITVTGPTTFSLNGTAGNGAYTSGGTVGIAKTVLTTGAVPTSNQGALWGLILANNVSTPNTDLDIAPGQCMDDTNTDLMVIPSGLTKRLSSTWAVGTGNGASDTGTIPTSGTVHVFVIKRTDTGVVDIFTSTSLTPTLPTGYSLKRRIGSLITDTSAHLLAFTQYADEFYLNTPILDVNVTNPGTALVTRTLSVPAGFKVKALMNGHLSNGSSTQVLAYIKSPDLPDLAPSVTTSPLATLVTENNSATANYAGCPIFVMTNASAQIDTRLSVTGANVTLKIATLGWIDNRGRLN